LQSVWPISENFVEPYFSFSVLVSVLPHDINDTRECNGGCSMYLSGWILHSAMLDHCMLAPPMMSTNSVNSFILCKLFPTRPGHTELPYQYYWQTVNPGIDSFLREYLHHRSAPLTSWSHGAIQICLLLLLLNCRRFHRVYPRDLFSIPELTFLGSIISHTAAILWNVQLHVHNVPITIIFVQLFIITVVCVICRDLENHASRQRTVPIPFCWCVCLHSLCRLKTAR